MPGFEEPEDKELCAGPVAALSHNDGPGGCGAVLLGGLQFGPSATAGALTTTTTATTTKTTTTIRTGEEK
jgi:hypothetical protein